MAEDGVSIFGAIEDKLVIALEDEIISIRGSTFEMIELLEFADDWTTELDKTTLATTGIDSFLISNICTGISTLSNVFSGVLDDSFGFSTGFEIADELLGVSMATKELED